MSSIAWLIYVAVIVFEIAAAWMVYVKANEPGWACIIPFYNFWVLLRIVGRPGWWLVLIFIPLVNLVVLVIVAIDLAKSFGQSVLFGIGLIIPIVNIVLIGVLGFGAATYAGPAGPEGRAMTPQAGMGYQQQAPPPPPPPPSAMPPASS